jgi:hypothetical protein
MVKANSGAKKSKFGWSIWAIGQRVRFKKYSKTCLDGHLELGVMVLVFNATFNNISVISWRSVLLVEETRVPWENHQPAASHWQSLSHNMFYSISVHLKCLI